MGTHRVSSRQFRNNTIQAKREAETGAMSLQITQKRNQNKTTENTTTPANTQINSTHTAVVLIRSIGTIQHKVADLGLVDAASAIAGELVCGTRIGCGGWRRGSTGQRAGGRHTAWGHWNVIHSNVTCVAVAHNTFKHHLEVARLVQSYVLAHPGISIVTRQRAHLLEGATDRGTSVDVEAADGGSVHVIVQAQLQGMKKKVTLWCTEHTCWAWPATCWLQVSYWIVNVQSQTQTSVKHH